MARADSEAHIWRDDDILRLCADHQSYDSEHSPLYSLGVDRCNRSVSVHCISYSNPMQENMSLSNMLLPLSYRDR